MHKLYTFSSQIKICYYATSLRLDPGVMCMEAQAFFTRRTGVYHSLSRLQLTDMAV